MIFQYIPAEVLVPPMLRIFRSRHVPAILRASSLSILALCADTSSIAIIPWSDEMAEAAVDLIQLESVPFTSDPPNATGSLGGKASNDKPTTTATSRLAYEDSFPALATTTKTPAFRRAALHFLALLIRTAVIRSYATDQGVPLQFESFNLALGARMATIVQYVHATDQDGVVRAQAGECVGLLGQLRRARLGL
jgi:Required for nuclear transport of RNA pol II C-terminus 2